MTVDPHQLGPYRIIRPVGRGGMGVVYEAVHTGLDKRVALKVLPRDLTAVRLERFLREARTAAGLHHTNIVPVFDVGQVDGVPYYAMQFIDGKPLDVLIEPAAAGVGTRTQSAEPVQRTHTFADRDATHPDLRPRPDPRPAQVARTIPPFRLVAELGVQAAEGLAYAHQRGVVHRDIKPTNLLLDGAGVVWITDFGLAFRADDPTLTAEGAILGTPRYMSPEQAQAMRTDARTDVYSLGITLYELLTGMPAFAGDSAMDTIHKVLSSNLPRPRSINPTIPRDLETVVLKAIARRADDRYSSGRELADDLKRFVAGEPVKARRIGPIGTAWRWSKRNPAVASLLAAILLIFAAGAGASAFYAKQATDREADARRNEQAANFSAEVARQRELEAIEQRNRVLTAEALNCRLVYAARISLAGVALREDDHARVSELLRETLPEPTQDDPRGWEWHYLFRTVHSEARVSLWPGHPAGPGRVAVIHGTDNVTRLAVLDPTTGSVLHSHPLPPDIQAAGDGWRFPVSADGRRLVYRTGSHLVIWDAETGREVNRLTLAGDRDTSPPALSPTGDRLVRFASRTDASDGQPAGATYEIWDAGSGQRRSVLTTPKRLGSTYSQRLGQFSPDGAWFGVCIDGRRVVVWDTKKNTLRLDRLLPARSDRDSSRPDNILAFASNGRLAVHSGDEVDLYDLTTPGDAPSASFAGFRGAVTAIEFTPNGGNLAVADETGTLTLVDLAGVAPRRVFRTVHRPLRSIAFSPDGTRIAARADGRLLEWALGSPSVIRLGVSAEGKGGFVTSTFHPDGRSLVYSGSSLQGRTVKPWLRFLDLDRQTERPILDEYLSRTPAQMVSWSGDGTRLAVVTAAPIAPFEVARQAGLGIPIPPTVVAAATAAWLRTRTAPALRVLITEPVSGNLLGQFWPMPTEVRAVRLSPRGRWVVLDSDRGFDIHAADTGRSVRIADPTADRDAVGIFTPDDSAFIVTRGETLRVCDLATGQDELLTVPGLKPGATPVFSPDGQWLVLRTAQGERLLVWETRSKKVVAELPLRIEPTDQRPVLFSPDGSQLLVPNAPRKYALVPVRKWTAELPLAGVTGANAEMTFTRDSQRILGFWSVDRQAECRVWDTRSGQELLAIRLPGREQSGPPTFGLAFDGNRLRLTRQAAGDGGVEIESLDGSAVPDELARQRLGIRPSAPGSLR